MGVLEAHSLEFISPPLLVVKLRDEDVAGCPAWLRSPTAVLRNPCRNQSVVLLWVADAFLCPEVSFLQLTMNLTSLNMSQETKKLGSHLKAAPQKAPGGRVAGLQLFTQLECGETVPLQWVYTFV